MYKRVRELSKRNLTVLFAEDNADVRTTIEKSLKTVFTKVYTCENGEEARQILQEHFVDVLITDINMPKESGVELIMHARKLHGALPIIITTAHDEFKLYESLNKISVLVKPYSILDIIKIIDNYIDDIEAHRQTKDALCKLEEIYPEAQRILDLIQLCEAENKVKESSEFLKQRI